MFPGLRGMMGASLAISMPVSVKSFGATGNGTTDDTAAIQRAIDFWTGGYGAVYFPDGSYKVTSVLTVSQGRVTLFGNGRESAYFVFAPTGNGTCLKFSAGASVLYHPSVRGLGFYSSDTTYTKTAIEFSDCSGATYEDITIGVGGVQWAGGSAVAPDTQAGSIGIRFRGREQFQQSNVYINADRPIVISANPNNAISLDHSNFDNLTMINTSGAQAPLVEVDTGLNLTHVSFGGYQAWVGGSNGLKWVDTTSVGVSIALKLSNVRWEQQQGSGGYLARIEHNTGLQQFTADNCYVSAGGSCKGIKLRKATAFAIDAFYGGASTALDADSTNDNGRLNLFCNDAGASVSLGATRLGGRYTISGSVVELSPSAPAGGSTITQKWNPSKTLGFSQIEPQSFNVGANSTVTFAEDTLQGIVTVYETVAAVGAVFAVKGANHSVKLLSQSDSGWFGVTVGAANINLYWDAGTSRYMLQNTIGSPLTFYVTNTGAGER